MGELSLKKSFGLILITLLLGGCPREQKQPTLDEILGNTDLLDNALSHDANSNIRTGPPPSPPPPLPKTGPLVISNIQVLQGALEVPAVHKDFRRRQARLLDCYAITLRKNPKGQGKVGIQLTLNERGRVTETLILENTVGEYLSECLLKKLQRFRFPDKPNPKGQVKAQLEFSPQ
jgi:hypothetical protein